MIFNKKGFLYKPCQHCFIIDADISATFCFSGSMDKLGMKLLAADRRQREVGA